MPPGQVLLAPNFAATVARSFYSDAAHPDCRFVDLTEDPRKRDVYVF